MTTVKLSQAIKIDGKQVKSLKLRDINFGDLTVFATAPSEFAATRTILARLASIPEDAVDGIGLVDFPAINAAIDKVVKPHLN